MNGPGAGQEPKYFEVFFSRPSWKRVYLEFQGSPAPLEWCAPKTCKMVDASHIREQFRVFRGTFPATASSTKPLQFILVNGNRSSIVRPASGDEKSCFEIGEPGRFVVEQEIRKVGDVDTRECKQVVTNPRDKHIELSFVADLWEKCYCVYSADEGEWTPAPGKEMTLVGESPRKFSVTIAASRLVFALNSGGEEPSWDSNNGENVRYHMALHSAVRGMASSLTERPRFSGLHSCRDEWLRCTGARRTYR